MENTKKITKTQVLEAIKENVENMVLDGEVTAEDVVNYVDTTIAQIANKSAKAKEKAAEKKAEGDALRDKILAVLTNELQDADAITAQIEDEEVTKAKVIARLTQLIANELAVKEAVKNPDGKGKKMAYKLK